MSWSQRLYWRIRAGQVRDWHKDALDWLFAEQRYRCREQQRATDEGMPERVL